MNNTFRDMLDIYVIVHLDDILINSKKDELLRRNDDIIDWKCVVDFKKDFYGKIVNRHHDLLCQRLRQQPAHLTFFYRSISVARQSMSAIQSVPPEICCIILETLQLRDLTAAYAALPYTWRASASCIVILWICAMTVPIKIHAGYSIVYLTLS